MKTLCITFVFLLCIFVCTLQLSADDGYQFRGGVCLLRGQIKNMPGQEMPKMFTIHLKNLFLDEDANYLVHVNSDGTFHENVALPHSQFAFWSNFKANVFLMVGDTVDVVYDAGKGLEFSGNNVTAQVNRYYPMLRKKYLSEYRKYPEVRASNQVYEDFIDFNFLVFEKIKKDIDKSLPADCMPLTRNILKASLLSAPLVNVFEARNNHKLTQFIMKSDREWITNENYRPLDNKKFFLFLLKNNDYFIDNPYLIMGADSWLPYNRMDYDIFKIIDDVSDYRLEQQDYFSENLAWYASDFFLPKDYEPEFLKQAKVLRNDLLFTYSDFIEKQFQEYNKNTKLGNNFAFQIALCHGFKKSSNSNRFHGDHLTERLIAIIPYLTYPQVRFHLLQYYRNCIREQEGASENRLLEKDSVFQRIINPYAGNVLYVDFWGMSCGPCRAGMLEQREMVEKLKNKPVKFLYICNVADSPRESAEAWMKENNIQGEHIYISPDDWAYLQAHFQFSGIPFALILNKEGRLLDNQDCNLTVEFFEDLINE